MLQRKRIEFHDSPTIELAYSKPLRLLGATIILEPQPLMRGNMYLGRRIPLSFTAIYPYNSMITKLPNLETPIAQGVLLLECPPLPH